MRTHVTFRTRAFPLDDDTAARWLAAALAEQGVVTDSEPGHEDWGWTVFATRDGAEFWLGVGPMQDDDDPRTWLVFANHGDFRIVQRFTRRGRAALAELLDAVNAALRTHPDITEIAWHEQDDFLKGSPVPGTDRP